MLSGNILSQVSTAEAHSGRPGRSAVANSNFHLLRELIRRDFNARFRGSALGLSWAIIQPVTLVALYWFVFTYLIGGGPGATNPRYIEFLITGLIPWLALSEGVIRSMTVIVENGALVRRLALRSELLVIVPNVSAAILEIVALVLFTVLMIVKGNPATMIWLLPLAVAIQLAVQIGIGWIVAVVYVFFRDLGQIAGFALSVLFYLSPILYPIGGRLEPFFVWNPITPLLGLFRTAILSAALPDVRSIVFLLIVAAGIFATGLLFFRRAQGTLADII